MLVIVRAPPPMLQTSAAHERSTPDAGILCLRWRVSRGGGGRRGLHGCARFHIITHVVKTLSCDFEFERTARATYTRRSATRNRGSLTTCCAFPLRCTTLSPSLQRFPTMVHSGGCARSPCVPYNGCTAVDVSRVPAHRRGFPPCTMAAALPSCLRSRGESRLSCPSLRSGCFCRCSRMYVTLSIEQPCQIALACSGQGLDVRAVREGGGGERWRAVRESCGGERWGRAVGECGGDGQSRRSARWSCGLHRRRTGRGELLAQHSRAALLRRFWMFCMKIVCGGAHLEPEWSLEVFGAQAPDRRGVPVGRPGRQRGVACEGPSAT